MDEWKQRVIEEHMQMSERVDKLERFTQSDDYKKVSATESSRLRLQLNLMRSYRNVLYDRIKNDFK